MILGKPKIMLAVLSCWRTSPFAVSSVTPWTVGAGKGHEPRPHGRRAIPVLALRHVELGGAPSHGSCLRCKRHRCDVGLGLDAATTLPDDDDDLAS